MIDSLAGAVVDPLARRWTTRTIGAALAFWLAGAAIFVLRDPIAAVCAGPTAGQDAPYCRLIDSGRVGAGLAAGLAAAVVIGTANIGAALAPSVTHLLSGVFWPVTGWAARFTAWQVARHTRARQKLATIAPFPVAGQGSGLPWAEGRLRARLRRYPGCTSPAPTALGNVFAAMSQRITDRHGLRVSTCWATFLTVLPEPARQRLAAQSTVMLGRAQGVVFAAGALGWTVLAPTPGWAVVWVAVTCSVIGGTYLGLRHSAQSYCDLIEGQVAAHRAALYRAVGFPLPESTQDEPRLGAELSDYLEANAEAAVPLRWAAGEPA